MANIDEALLGKKNLNQDEQGQAEKALAQDRTAKKSGFDGEEREGEGDSLEEKKASARRNKKKNGTGAEKGKKEEGKEPAMSGASKATSELLKKSWISLIGGFIPALIYINLHVFGHSVFGEKMFCDLGEEWLPDNLKSSPFSEKFKSKAKKIGLLEKAGLAFLDLLILLCLLMIVAFFIMIIDFMSKGWWEKGVTILKLGWDGIKVLVDLFVP